MKNDSAKLACGPHGWRLAVAATLGVACVAAAWRFCPNSQGRAQDRAPDPPRGVENVPIERIKSMIDSTPANQIRNPTKASLPAQRYDSFERSANWTAGHSIVLIHGSMNGVPLTALDGSGHPQPEAKWKVIRNPDDSPALQEPPYNGNLTINPAEGTKTATATLSLNKFGSFSVVAYIDRNADGDFNEGEPAVFYNIVVCQVLFLLDHCGTFRDRIDKSFLTGFQYSMDSMPHDPSEAFFVRFGVQNNPGVSLDVQIAVGGGGADGRLGLDRVYCGWTNVCSRWDATASYANNHSAIDFLPDVDVPTPPNYITAAALPTQEFSALNPGLAAAKPLLDVGEEDPGTGGDSICMYPRGEDTVQPDPEFGQIRRAWASDYPALPAVSPHPKHPNSDLTQFDVGFDFTARLVLWTQSQRGVRAGATLYTCVYEVPWLCRATYNQFNWGVPHTCVEVAKNIAFNAKAKHEPPVRMESIQGEVMPPVLNDRSNLIDAHQ